MARLEEQITVAGNIDEVFAYVADFANSAQWDPGVVETEHLTAGPVGVGSRFKVVVAFFGRTSPMEYVVTEFEPTRRVVLAGEGAKVTAVDEISFEAAPAGGTTITYVAEINLKGPLRLVQPFLGGAFDRIGRKAMEGLLATLGPPS